MRKTKKKKSRSLKNFLINILLLFAVSFICVIIIEGGLRIILNDSITIRTKYHDTYVYTFNPDQINQKYNSPDHDLPFVYTTTKEGWLGPQFEYDQKINKTKRVLVIGDSFTSQLNLKSYDHIFSELVESQLTDTDVVTIGVGSYAFDNEYKIFENELEKYNPDLVIFATFINDLYDTTRNNVFILNNNTLKDITPRQIPLIRKALFLCRQKSYLCNMLTNNIIIKHANKLNKITNFLKISDIKRDVSLQYKIWGMPDELFLENLTNVPTTIKTAHTKTDLILSKIKKISKTKNLTVVFMLIPIKEQIDSRKKSEFFNKYPKLDSINFNFSKPYNTIKKMLINKKFTIINLEPLFIEKNKNNSHYFEIDGHWNEKGHELAAEVLKQYLLSKGFE
ncbi:SGNH/GDSL hydrolase family protein [Candidatus Woesearchaeota archaeon]|jgi:hypothetical protein|nr:SGNH/GDSL hydrolase family protein [Candidatus Woesearchaeota archaeon]